MYTSMNNDVTEYMRVLKIAAKEGYAILQVRPYCFIFSCFTISTKRPSKLEDQGSDGFYFSSLDLVYLNAFIFFKMLLINFFNFFEPKITKTYSISIGTCVNIAT